VKSANATSSSIESDVLLELIEKEAVAFMEGPVNTNRSATNPEKAYGRPFMGVAAGDDDYWDLITQIAGERHWQPLEAFKKAFPELEREPSDLSVMAIVCPQTEATIAEQKTVHDFPVERWIRSRFYHNQTVGVLCEHLVEYLRSLGVRAMIPDQLSDFQTYAHERFQLTSTWSIRHVAYAAGLGTFGLCQALITKVGKAHRMGSIIIDQRLRPNPRPYSQPYEYCLYFASGGCKKCLDRCPVKSISLERHDKSLCDGFLKHTKATIPSLYPDLTGAYGCGLCQVNVPCGTKIPGHHEKVSG
jgi:ferredoxin